MPIKLDVRNGLLVSTLNGVVSDCELLTHYGQLRLPDLQAPWRELVDGRDVSDMKITPAGQRALAVFLTKYVDVLSGGRVAMVATTNAVSDMFRLWEKQRDHLPYQVKVFREMKPALDWLSAAE